jgi:pyruvate/2-oxoglutarate dehydrogenase complex dihydrolipoamide dehydrogenase (E3) component
MNVDLCVIGAGSGGLSVAAGAAQMGARTVLIEKHKMGGDCLNYGCVPSKALIAAGHAAAAQRGSGPFGVRGVEPVVDFAAVNAHVHGVIAAIAPNDSVARFEGLGVTVMQGAARFVSREEVAVGEARIRAKIFVVATGSRAGVPPIPGLADVPYLTNETVFDLKACPEHLVVIGGGPIGLELAQAHRRLGARVTVLEAFTVMGKDDPELVAVVRARLAADGVAIREGVKIARVARDGAGVAIAIEADGKAETITASHLLVAAGRIPNVDGLGLDEGGVAYSKKGVTVDGGLRSISNKRVYAVGDAAGSFQFTHIAGYHAGIVIRRALFRLFWTKTDERAVPWVTFTDPELAQVGLTEAEAKKRGHAVTVARWPFHDNDRAQAERATEGQIKVVLGRKGRILGCGIVGRQAGELIQPWILAIQNGFKIGKMTGYIAPYPTLGEVSKRAAGAYFTPALFSARTRRIIRFLLRLP